MSPYLTYISSFTNIFLYNIYIYIGYVVVEAGTTVLYACCRVVCIVIQIKDKIYSLMLLHNFQSGILKQHSTETCTAIVYLTVQIIE